MGCAAPREQTTKATSLCWGLFAYITFFNCCPGTYGTLESENHHVFIFLASTWYRRIGSGDIPSVQCMIVLLLVPLFFLPHFRSHLNYMRHQFPQVHSMTSHMQLMYAEAAVSNCGKIKHHMSYHSTGMRTHAHTKVCP